ncbi:MAG: aminotransferase class I/II-fold pyridoxal phosphate-dependent enzyme [Clostridia bacterium]|nr:aminotransferase class I/II-fold pyridoxal phosphate-dependent enzyme [Clostridia bacterium]
MSYSEFSKNELLAEQEKLQKEYDSYVQKGLSLDMSRGKPCSEQLDISVHMLDIVNSGHDCRSKNGLDCRNYGLIDGLPSCRELFSEFIQVKPEQVMVGGNSSLNMMFDTISCMMTTSIAEGCAPWYEVKDRKFLCPVPGYDRHFAITEYYGFEMIPVPMTEAGPDMDVVEKLVSSDPSIKGIWCVPKYSNPTGITYSDETVRRFANLKPAAPDFRIMWDDAYCVHDIADEGDTLLSLMDECEKAGNPDLPIIFCSTSKITFPGSGVAAMASSEANMKVFRKRYSCQTIGYDKINMLRHMLFFKDFDGVKAHMQKHKEILKPRFDVVINKFNEYLKPCDIAKWNTPRGGYFVSIDVYPGTAKEVFRMCADAGLVLTSAGATYPLGFDPQDSNIRIAPSFPPLSELEVAMDVFCVCVRLCAVRKILSEID